MSNNVIGMSGRMRLALLASDYLSMIKRIVLVAGVDITLTVPSMLLFILSSTLSKAGFPISLPKG